MSFFYLIFSPVFKECENTKIIKNQKPFFFFFIDCWIRVRTRIGGIVRVGHLGSQGRGEGGHGSSWVEVGMVWSTSSF